MPLAHEGRPGVWFEETAWGDTLAGIEREKGAERVKTEMERLSRELAEQKLRQVEASLQPAMQWVRYGLPSLLGGTVLGFVLGFVLGRR